MATIIIHTGGTLGDHLPYIALAQTLTQRGHRVRLAINQAMLPYAHKAGLETIPLTDVERGPEEAREHAWAWNHWQPSDEKQRQTQINSSQYTEQFVTRSGELIDLCRRADLLISTSIRAEGFIAHSAVGLPWLTASMNPSHFWTPTVPAERESRRQARAGEYERLIPLITHTWQALGIKQTIPRFAEGWLFARHVLLAGSPHFSRPDVEQMQPHASLDQTGFWFYEDPDWQTWQPDPALAEFCERRPLALAFSSQPLENPRQTLLTHVAAAAHLHMPLLIQRGWAGFSEDDLPADVNRNDVMFADFMPHDWLFARAAAAIQHGGIGSIARALRQGCPLLIEPFGNDQFYNAAQAVNLGAAAAMHPFQLTVDGLVRVLREKVLVNETRQRAAAIGRQIAAEDGLTTAAEMIERYLGRFDAQGQLPAIYQRFTPPLTSRRRKPIVAPPPTATPVMEPEPEPELPPLPTNTAAEMLIPKILHQTWDSAELGPNQSNIPPHLAEFRQTWQIHHPDWEFRLWSDVDNREFIRKNYNWFLPIYDGYPEMIMRVDAVRYFILYHYGGVYADLDMECLRPLEPLLAGKAVVFGLEHSDHLQQADIKQRALRRIVGNAIMASTPGHPFWEHVFKQLVGHHRAPGPLDATGPFLLSRAYESYADQPAISLESAALLYPISNKKLWPDLPPETRERVRQTAYTIHHWEGSWWQNASKTPLQVKLSLLVRGQIISTMAMEIERYRDLLYQADELPRVSCLMVTRDRSKLAKFAVSCFRRQTYPNRELVIVDDGQDDTLEQWVSELADDQIVYIRLPDEGYFRFQPDEGQSQSLGQLRNIAVARASGDYVAQWDDDDLSDPIRLETQMAALSALNADACLLEREQLWWPRSQRLAYSTRRLWEGSFIAVKAKLPPYPNQRRGEDSPVIEQITGRQRVAVLDYPGLYTYVFHEGNTFANEHWEQHWLAATESFEGGLYAAALETLQQRLGVNLGNFVAGFPATSTATPSVEVPAETPSPPARLTTFSKVLILVPVKNAEPHLTQFWDNIKALSYPREKISIAFLESDSADNTYQILQESLPELKIAFADAKLFKQDYNYHLNRPRWEPGLQYQRRAVMAKSRNQLLSQALTDEDWVLWLDVDVARWPADIIQQLLAVDKDVVTPNCVSLETRQTFDYNTFKLKPNAAELDWSPYLIDGIVQPPKGFGRLYLSDLRQHDLVELDGVGATMLLVRADLHREGLVFPTFSYKQHIETEGLALMARDMGYQCWGLPNVKIFHP